MPSSGPGSAGARARRAPRVRPPAHPVPRPPGPSRPCPRRRPPPRPPRPRSGPSIEELAAQALAEAGSLGDLQVGGSADLEDDGTLDLDADPSGTRSEAARAAAAAKAKGAAQPQPTSAAIAALVAKPTGRPARAAVGADGVLELEGHGDSGAYAQTVVMQRLGLGLGLAVVLWFVVPVALDFVAALQSDTEDYATLMGLPPTEKVLGPIARCMLAADTSMGFTSSVIQDEDRTVARLARSNLRGYSEGSVSAAEMKGYNELQANLARIASMPDSQAAAEAALRLGAKFYVQGVRGKPEWEGRFRVGNAFRRMLPRSPSFTMSPEPSLDVPPELVLRDGEDPFERLATLGTSYWKDSQYRLVVNTPGPIPAQAARSLSRLVGLVPPEAVDRSIGTQPVEEILVRLGDDAVPAALAAIGARKEPYERQELAARFGTVAMGWKDPARTSFLRVLLRSGWNAAVPRLPEGEPWADALRTEFAESPYGAVR